MVSSPECAAPRKRLLLVEDEPVIAFALESTLRELGFELVTTATRVSSALEAIDRETFDYAILDVSLGSQRIDAVADALAARGCPFFFMTGYETGDVPSGHAARAVLQKPFRLKQLLAALSTEFGFAAEAGLPPHGERPAKPSPSSAIPAPGPAL